MLSGLEPGQSYEIRVIAMSSKQADEQLAVGPGRIVNTVGGKLKCNIMPCFLV